MEALWMGIAGLLATVVSSGMGLYFTSKARTDPHRELLYRKQLDLAADVILTIGRVRVLAPMITAKSEWEERALEDLRPQVKRMGELADLSAALLPTPLYVEVQKLSGVVTDFLVAYDQGFPVDAFPERLAGHATKTALLARTYLGVDELSQETADMLKKGAVEHVAAFSPEQIVESAKKHLSQSDS
jgi:hypothetical protein